MNQDKRNVIIKRPSVVSWMQEVVLDEESCVTVKTAGRAADERDFIRWCVEPYKVLLNLDSILKFYSSYSRQ